MRSYDEVFAKFEREGFQIGPHKAFQIARDAARVRAILVSEMAPELVRRLLLTPAESIDGGTGPGPARLASKRAGGHHAQGFVHDPAGFEPVLRNQLFQDR